MSQLTKELALNAQKGDGWKFGNDILYKLCQDFPKHDTSSQIVGKIWLIGRSYAAAIERRKTGVAEIPGADDISRCHFLFLGVTAVVICEDCTHLKHVLNPDPPDLHP